MKITEDRIGIINSKYKISFLNIVGKLLASLFLENFRSYL